MNISISVLNEKPFWTTEDVASYLGYSIGHFQDRIRTLPDFPSAIRLPRPTGGRGKPRWKPEEIKAWVDKYKEAA